MTTQTTLPGLPPELNGWRWQTHPDGSVQLRADGWATNWYQKPERAIAEAKRRVLSTPKPKPVEQQPTVSAVAAAVERGELAAPTISTIPLDAIRTDGGTQARAGLDEATVAEYAATWDDLARQQNGLDRMPPIVLFYDGASYWLADGFHRVAAYKQFLESGSASGSPRALRAEVRQGTRRDAVLYACGANAAHGLRRSSADKRRAIETLFRDEEWCGWSDRRIAEACAVHHELVGRVRQELGLTGGIRQSANGRTIDTTGISRANTARKAESPAAPTPQPCTRCGEQTTEYTSYGAGLVPEYPGQAVRLCGRCVPTLLAERARARQAPPGMEHARTRGETDLDDTLFGRLVAAGYRWQSADRTPDGRWHHIVSFRDKALERIEQRRMRRERLAALADDGVPHLPPDFRAVQQRAEKLGLHLNMNACGVFTLLNEAGAGTTIYTWPDVLKQLAEKEQAAVQSDVDRIEQIHAAIDWNAIGRSCYHLGATSSIGEAWAMLGSIVRELSRPDPAGAMAWLLTEAAALAGDDLEAYADQLDDAEYEALSRLLRPAVPTPESEGIHADV